MIKCRPITDPEQFAKFNKLVHDYNEQLKRLSALDSMSDTTVDLMVKATEKACQALKGQTQMILERTNRGVDAACAIDCVISAATLNAMKNEICDEMSCEEQNIIA